MSIVSSPTTSSSILTSLSSFIVCIQAYETIYVWDLLKVSIVERICWPFQDTSLGQRLQLFKYLESWSFSIFQVFLFSSGTLLVFELPRHESQSQGLKHWPAKQCRLRGASVYQIACFFCKTSKSALTLPPTIGKLHCKFVSPKFVKVYDEILDKKYPPPLHPFENFPKFIRLGVQTTEAPPGLIFKIHYQGATCTSAQIAHRRWEQGRKVLTKDKNFSHSSFDGGSRPNWAW